MPPRKFAAHLSSNRKRGVIIDSDSDTVVLEFDIDDDGETEAFIAALIKIMNSNADDLPSTR